MKKTSVCTGIGACIGMMLLILDGKTALAGAQAGMELVIRTVIPSLFPFFFLSILLTSSLNGSSLFFLRPLAKLCHIPSGAEPILLSGFLGGYPAGAQAVAAAHSGGSLSKEDAQRMLAFCNNAGPSFLFGMVSAFFPEPWMVWALWGIHIAGAAAAAQFFPCSAKRIPFRTAQRRPSLSEVLLAAVSTMTAVCGWVILFRILIAFLDRWLFWLLNPKLQTAVTGLLELSNGCCMLSAVGDIPLRFLLCSCMLALGGFCVTMQTVSVTQGLSLRCYFIGKLIQAAFSAGFSCLILFGSSLPAIALLTVFAYLLLKRKKSSSFQEAVRV